MLCEEGMVVAGLLMGLNAIDYNIMMKGEGFVSMWSFTDSVHSFLIIYRVHVHSTLHDGSKMVYTS